jgi:predicted restriction endonuclease
MIEETSSQIGEILEVLDIVFSRNPQTLAEVRQARVKGIKEVSDSRSIGRSSVADKCQRKLRLKSIKDFDKLAFEWLKTKDASLQNLLLQHTASRPSENDVRAISKFFQEGKLQISDSEQIERDLTRRKQERIHEEKVVNEFSDRFASKDFSVPDTFSYQKTRQGQKMWRRNVLENFRSVCCICGLDMPILLEASHIRSWNESPLERLDPRNGLCLCATHHTAYDKKIIEIDSKGIVRVTDDQISRSTNPMVVKLIRNFEGVRIAQPMKEIRLGPTQK